MDRDAILDTLPTDDELRAAPPYRLKEAAENLVRSMLDALDVDRREPDQWEADHLAQALGYIVSRFYRASIVATEVALAPSEERANPESWERTDQTLTKRALRDGLDYVAGMPAPNA